MALMILGVGCGAEPEFQIEDRPSEQITIEWLLGLVMLLGTLMMSALLGHLQSWGKNINVHV
jgi:hypothetical protein